MQSIETRWNVLYFSSNFRHSILLRQDDWQLQTFPIQVAFWSSLINHRKLSKVDFWLFKIRTSVFLLNWIEFFSQCGGNSNNFGSLEECEGFCVDTQCETGQVSDSYTNFFYFTTFLGLSSRRNQCGLLDFSSKYLPEGLFLLAATLRTEQHLLSFTGFFFSFSQGLCSLFRVDLQWNGFCRNALFWKIHYCSTILL